MSNFVPPVTLEEARGHTFTGEGKRASCPFRCSGDTLLDFIGVRYEGIRGLCCPKCERVVWHDGDVLARRAGAQEREINE